MLRLFSIKQAQLSSFLAEKPLVCRTPNGEKGDCLNIFECEPFLKLLTDRTKISMQQRQFIRASECKRRKAGESPFVCCGTLTNYTQMNKAKVKS